MHGLKWQIDQAVVPASDGLALKPLLVVPREIAEGVRVPQ